MNKLGKSDPLPRVPIGREKTQDEFWLQQGNSGAINAFRQLTSSRAKGGRKKTSLPGGKLKPLFKNHAPTPRNLFGHPGARQVLPGITSPTIETSTTSAYVVSGYLDNLPPEDPTAVRVYLCSNYADMKAERAILMKKAVPELQQFCSDYGLHFQLVDFHWGVVNGAHSLNSSSTLRIKEIKASHKLSLGPAFVVLQGDKYGAPRLPPVLSPSDYNVLVSTASENNLPGVEALTKFYKKDENSTGACYVLHVEDEIDELNELSQVLARAAVLAYRAEKLTEDQYNRLTMSIVEEEIEHGIFPLKDPRHHCLLYRREWQHIDFNHVEAEAAVDMTVNEEGEAQRDTTSRKRITSVVNRIHRHLGPTHCKSYYLRWSEADGHMWAPTPEVAKYLDNFCSDFVADCKHLIEQGLKRVGENKAANVSVYSEVLFQSHLWASKSAFFHGQESLLFRIENFLQDPRRNMKPFVIYGPPGSGKTATMAHLAERLRSSCTASCVVVLRFLGTSAESSNIYSTVVGITTQICMAYGLRVPKLDVHMNTLYRALRTFRDTMEAVSQEQASARPLYILLDGIDQLQPMDESLRALWAICELPHNVHMIISTVEQAGQVNLIKAFQNFVCGEGSSAPMETLTSADAKAVLGSTLQANQRKVTSEQEAKILAAFEVNPSPLLLKLLVNNALHVKSFGEVPLGDSDGLDGMFNDYLQGMELKYGKQTIKKILSYISVSGIGIHEKELLDLLLCDEEVMEEASRLYILHPDGVAGFPPILWANIKNDLDDLIEEHNAFGVTVLGWNHSLYAATVAEMFGVVYPGIDESKITSEGTTLTLGLHEYITNMYLHEDEESHSNVVSNWAIPETDEIQGVTLISPQPVNVHNVLKLQKLPIHFFVLIPIEGLERLIKVMFGSLLWLRTKLKAVSIQSVLHDISPVITLSKHFLQEGVIEDHLLHNDLQIILEFLQLAKDALINDPDSIVQEILARLPDLTDTYPTVASLVSQAHQWMNQSKRPQLAPVYPCLPQPNNPLRHTLENPSHVVGFLKKKNLGVLFSQRSSVDVWKLDTGELLHRFAVNPEQSVESVIPMNNEEYIIIAHYSHLKHVMELGVWGIETGIQVLSSTFEYRFEAVALDPSDKQLMVSTVLDQEQFSEGGQRVLLGVNIYTRDVLTNIIVEDIHNEGISKIIFANNVNEAVDGLLTIGSKMSKDLAFWNLATEELRFCIELEFFADHVQVLTNDSLAVCTGSDSGTVAVVDLEEGTIRQKLSRPEYEGHSSMYVSREADHVLLATKHHGVAIINLGSETQIKTIGEPVQFNMRPSNGKLPTTLPIPTQLTMDPAEHFLFVGCLNGLINIYNIATGDYVDTLKGHKKTVNSLVFDQQGRLFSASDDGISRVWQVMPILEQYLSKFTADEVNAWDGIRQFEEGFTCTLDQEKTASPSHPTEREEVNAVAITSDGEHIVTASASKTVKLWAVDNGVLVKTYGEGSGHGASHVYLAYKDQFVVAHCHNPGSSRTNTLQIWRRDTGEVVKLSDKPILVFTSCGTPDGGRLFTVSPSEKKASGIVLGLYDLYDPRKLASLPCNIYGAMDSTNMRLLGCCSRTNRTLSEIASLPVIPGSPVPTETTAQTPSVEEEEEKMYVVLDYFPENDVSYFFTFVIGAESISMERHVPLHMDTRSPQCTVLTAAASGVSGAVDGSLVQWDVGAHTVMANLADPSLERAAREGGLRYPSSTGRPGHDGPVTCVRLASDGEHLVTGGVDRMVKVWHLAQHTLLKVLAGHSDMVLSVDISGDRRLVASGSADKTVAVWSIANGSKMASFCTHSDPVDVTIVNGKSRVFAISCGNLISLKMINM